jgi:hypothetical protein
MRNESKIHETDLAFFISTGENARRNKILNEILT